MGREGVTLFEMVNTPLLSRPVGCLKIKSSYVTLCSKACDDVRLHTEVK